MNSSQSLYLDHTPKKPNLKQTRDCDILIISVINDLEEKFLHQHLVAAGATTVKPTENEKDNNLVRWRLPSLRHPGANIEILTKCLEHAGNGSAGIELMHLLYRSCRPAIVAFCGIGGSLDVEDAQLGNVFVGSAFEWRGYDKISQGGSDLELRNKIIYTHYPNESFINQVKNFAHDNASGGAMLAEGLLIEHLGDPLRDALVKWKTRHEANPVHEQDIKSFKHLDYASDRKPRVKFGGIMSWDYVLNSRQLREEIRKTSKIYKAVDMESGGITRALRKVKDFSGNEIEFLAVRGISDLCSSKSDDLFRFIAADHAAAFLVGFLRHRFSPLNYS